MFLNTCSCLILGFFTSCPLFSRDVRDGVSLDEKGRGHKQRKKQPARAGGEIDNIRYSTFNGKLKSHLACLERRSSIAKRVQIENENACAPFFNITSRALIDTHLCFDDVRSKVNPRKNTQTRLHCGLNLDGMSMLRVGSVDALLPCLLPLIQIKRLEARTCYYCTLLLSETPCLCLLKTEIQASHRNKTKSLRRCMRP